MRIGMFVVLSFVLSMPLVADERKDKIDSLEQAFATSVLEVIQKTGALPEDVFAILRSQLPSHKIAEFGEHWNPTDNVGNNVPIFRHIFSGVSNEIAAVAYQSGGHRVPMVFMLLMKRNSDWYCEFDITSRFDLTISIEMLPYLFQDQTESKPNCRLRTVSSK